MKKSKALKIVIASILIVIFGLFALASSESTETDQGSGTAQTGVSTNNLGDYNVEIKSCRLAKDYEDKDVVIVKYGFTNNGEEPAAFYIVLDEQVYQSGIGLNEAYMLKDDANYSSDNQTKEIKNGASLDVEVAYELNDTTTEIEVEVEETFSFSDNVVKKKFSIA